MVVNSSPLDNHLSLTKRKEKEGSRIVCSQWWRQNCHFCTSVCSTHPDRWIIQWCAWQNIPRNCQKQNLKPEDFWLDLVGFFDRVGHEPSYEPKFVTNHGTSWFAKFCAHCHLMTLHEIVGNSWGSWWELVGRARGITKMICINFSLTASASISC